MVHRQYSGLHSFENTGDQSWNNMPVEQVDVELAREPNVQHRALVYPVENINRESVRFTATWTSPRSTGVVPFGRSDGFQHHQPNIAALSKLPVIHQSSVGAFKSVPESFDSHASSSNYVCHTFYDANNTFTEPNIDAHMHLLKRKGPVIPSAYEAGSSSRYFSGSSSNFPVASEICHEKTRNDSVQTPCHCFCTDDCYNCNGLEVRSEGSLRNIRSRTEVDSNYNDARVPVPTNAYHSTFCTSNAIEHYSMANHQGQNSNALTRRWNNNIISHAHGRDLTPDPGIFRLELGRAFVGSNNGAPCEAVSSDVISGRNSVTRHSSAQFEAVSSDVVLSGRNSTSRQGFHGPSSQSLRHSRSNYSQRSSRDFRHPSNGMHSGNMGLSEARLYSGSDGYQRHRRSVLGVGWHHGDRNRRSRVCHESYRSFHEPEGGHHHQLDYEGLMAMDRSTIYASRNMYDQHRDLRLDIDSMSYEDLLALGERMGSVSTGLSEDAMKKCFIESLYCSYDQLQDDSRCVICLEEYGNTDKVGKLKACGHDYHVSCIRKWLSMKNLCPICKAPALEEVVV